MKQIRLAALAIVAVLAVSALVATTAQAAETEGPYYRVEGTRLASGHALAIEAKALKPMVMKVSGITIECTKLAISNAKIKGSSGKNGGTSEEALKFTGCTVTGNGSSCKVESEAITTEPLKNELVFEEPSRVGELSVLFVPTSGETFATLKFSGTCISTTFTVTGSFVGLLLEKPTGASPVKVGKEIETTGLAITFLPKETIKAYLLEEGALTEHTDGLSVLGEAFTQDGEWEIKLANGKKSGAYAAPPAQVEPGTEGPYYRVEGTRLEADKTLAITAKALKAFKLTSGAIVIQCAKLGVSSAYIVGSTGKNGGTSVETLKFTECSVTGNGTACEVENKAITTVPVKNELVFEETGRVGELGVLFVPLEGETFVTIKFTGTCTAKTFSLTGSFVGLLLEVSTGASPVNVGKEIENTSLAITFLPNSPIKAFLLAEGVLTEHEDELVEFGKPTTLEGEALIELATPKKSGA
jgi:hypothetical protein